MRATLAALGGGVAIGAVLTVGNVYVGLKTGSWDAGAVTGSLLGFALVRPLARALGAAYALDENNLTQTVAASAASMPSVMGLMSALPALAMLGHRVAAATAIAWALALAGGGVLLAIPLRELLVVRQRLPFPDAVATENALRALHGVDATASARARPFAIAALSSLVLTWFRDGFPSLYADTTPLGAHIRGVAVADLGIGIAWSPMLAAIGALIGLRNGIALLITSVFAWGWLAPRLVAEALISAPRYDEALQWLLWPGVALLASAGLVSLVVHARALVGALSDVTRLGQLPSRRRRAVAAIAVIAVLAIVAVGRIGFGVAPALLLVAVTLALAVAPVCTRLAGEVDIAPYGAFGQLAQLVFAWLAPAQPIANIVAASVVAGTAPQAVQTTTALKVGHLLGTPHRRQLAAQLVGIVAGAFIAWPTYAALVARHGVGTTALPAPFAVAWKAVAELAGSGAALVPPGAGWAAALAALAGALLVLGERTRAARFLPSPYAVGLAFLVPASTVVSLALGSLAGALARRAAPDWSGRNLVPALGGAIAGESLISAVAALLRTTIR
jgi:uncharacterized oligopeptide transporter (OPT) family protein